MASKLGRAYVKTHQYKKAIAYYRDAILSPENHALKIDLAELYLKLKQYHDAEEVLSQEISATFNSDDISLLQLRTKQLLLLARVHERAANLAASLTVLKDARDNQARVQQRLAVDQTLSAGGGAAEQARTMSKICVLMAEQSISLRDSAQAIHHYKEALRHMPNDLTIMAAMARLHMQMNEMELCQMICSKILEQQLGSSEGECLVSDSLG